MPQFLNSRSPFYITGKELGLAKARPPLKVLTMIVLSSKAITMVTKATLRILFSLLMPICVIWRMWSQKFKLIFRTWLANKTSKTIGKIFILVGFCKTVLPRPS